MTNQKHKILYLALIMLAGTIAIRYGVQHTTDCTAPAIYQWGAAFFMTVFATATYVLSLYVAAQLKNNTTQTTSIAARSAICFRCGLAIAVYLTIYAFGSLALAFFAYNVPPLVDPYTVPYAVLTLYVFAHCTLLFYRVSSMERDLQTAFNEAERKKEVSIVREISALMQQNKYTDEEMEAMVRQQFFVMRKTS